MQMEDVAIFSDEVIDAVGGFLSMTAGNVETKIAADYGEMNLSIPMVLMADNKRGNSIVNNSVIFCFTKDSGFLLILVLKMKN